MPDDPIDLARQIQDLASESSGNLVNPSKAKIKKTGENAARIYELAGEIIRSLQGDKKKRSSRQSKG